MRKGEQHLGGGVIVLGVATMVKPLTKSNEARRTAQRDALALSAATGMAGTYER